MLRYPFKIFAALLSSSLLPVFLEADAATDLVAGYPCTCTWEEVETTGQPRARHEAAFVALGPRFYLIGGRGMRPVNVYHVETNTWSEASTPPLEIHHFQPVVFDGKIYILGAMTGKFPRETPLERVLIFDPSADTWSWGDEIPEGRRRGACGVVVHDRRIYMVSGIVDGHWDGHVTWFDRYDPSTGVWEVLPDAPRARDHFQAAVLENKLYAVGGRRSSRKESFAATFFYVVPEVDVFDFTTGTWQTLASPKLDLPDPRAGTATIAHGPYVIVLGGESGRSPDAYARVDGLHTDKFAWHRFPDLITGRHGTGALVYDNALFTAAGNRTRGGGNELTSMERLKLEPPCPATPVESAF